MPKIHRESVVVQVQGSEVVLMDVEGREGDRYTPVMPIEVARVVLVELKRLEEAGELGGVGEDAG